ncbi:MAG: hypothetical protein V5A55_14400 [Halovenus sp.]
MARSAGPPVFLLGHGVENQAGGIYCDEEYLYVLELPSQQPFDEPSEWSLKVSDMVMSKNDAPAGN